jgi:hypothetical protein
MITCEPAADIFYAKLFKIIWGGYRFSIFGPVKNSPINSGKELHTDSKRRICRYMGLKWLNGSKITTSALGHQVTLTFSSIWPGVTFQNH